MQNPKDLMYVQTHEWVDLRDDTTAKIGITDFAQNALGDIVFIDLPEIGEEVEIGSTFADIESVKAVSEIYSPVKGIVKAVNEELIDAPEKINENAFDAWLIEVEAISEKGEFLSAGEYEAFCAEEE